MNPSTLVIRPAGYTARMADNAPLPRRACAGPSVLRKRYVRTALSLAACSLVVSLGLFGMRARKLQSSREYSDRAELALLDAAEASGRPPSHYWNGPPSPPMSFLFSPPGIEPLPSPPPEVKPRDYSEWYRQKSEELEAKREAERKERRAKYDRDVAHYEQELADYRAVRRPYDLLQRVSSNEEEAARKLTSHGITMLAVCAGLMILAIVPWTYRVVVRPVLVRVFRLAHWSKAVVVSEVQGIELQARQSATGNQDAESANREN